MSVPDRFLSEKTRGNLEANQMKLLTMLDAFETIMAIPHLAASTSSTKPQHKLRNWAFRYLRELCCEWLSLTHFNIL
jgi:hypothetical protein